jgi:hypothetical protein
MHTKKDETTGITYLMEGSEKIVPIPEGETGTLRNILVKIKEDLQQDKREYKSYLSINNDKDGLDVITKDTSGFWDGEYKPRAIISSRITQKFKVMEVSDVTEAIQALDDYTSIIVPTKLMDDRQKRIAGNYMLP